MKIRNKYVLREICGEKFFSEEGSTNADLCQFIKLNPTAAYLMETVGKDEFCPETLTDMLCVKYDVSRDDAYKDAKRLCETLYKNGISE